MHPLQSANTKSISSGSLSWRFIHSIFDIDADAWNAMWPSNYPFSQHAFFAALETSKSTSVATGWQPCHLLGFDDTDTLCIAMPLFIKSHSYGEYVFDWAWADAYQRHGLDYYPKIVNAIPFTPATGPRIGFAKHITANQQTYFSIELINQIKSKLAEIGGSSFHCLFPDGQSINALKQPSLLERHGCQFHWFNQNYTSFEHYLEHFISRKRKMIRKERKKVREHNLHIEMKTATEIDPQEWDVFYLLYHRTYMKRSGRAGYLGKEFFTELAKHMPEQLILATVKRDGETIAGAVYFKDDQTLYGRYWGAIEDIDGLHFETCYYLGIEYAIDHGLQRFDPGAQGEHKIQRGFHAVKTCSFHHVLHEGFHEAVEEFLQNEKPHNEAYIQDARNYLPFSAEHPEVNMCYLLETPSLHN